MMDNQDEEERRYPENSGKGKQIRQIGLTKEFLILLNAKGKIKYYNLADNALILEF